MGMNTTTNEKNTGWQGQLDGAGGLDANKRSLTNDELAALTSEFDKFDAWRAEYPNGAPFEIVKGVSK